MKKVVFSFLAFCALVATPALGADLPARLPAPAPPAPVTAAANWTGFYIGGNIGGVLEQATGTSNYVDPAEVITTATNVQSNPFSRAALLGGGQLGYNWQFAPAWIVGVEGDWDWTDPRYSFCRQTDPASAPCFDNARGFETIGGKTKWLATARARLGLTAGNWFFYGTGGAAWGKVETNLSLSCLVGGCGSSSTALFASSSSSAIKGGWVAGFGAEWMFASNWSARAEWLHIDLGTVSNSLTTFGISGGTPSTETAVWSRKEQYDQIRVGLSYLFR